MSNLFFLFESQTAPNDSPRFLVRVSSEDSLGRARDPYSAKESAKTLALQAVQNRSITIQGAYDITRQLEANEIPENPSVVAEFGPSGAVLIHRPPVGI
jgi:hypothetical protein